MKMSTAWGIWRFTCAAPWTSISSRTSRPEASASSMVRRDVP